MPVLDGNNYRAFIESATAGTFNQIAGQRALSYDTSLATYSVATKDSGAFDINGAGLLSLNLSVEVVPNLPDANGFTRCETLHNTRVNTARVQVRKSPFSGSDIIFDAPILVTGIPKSAPFNDTVAGPISFALSGVPTVNTLA